VKCAATGVVGLHVGTSAPVFQFTLLYFSALTLLVGHEEGHPVYKKTEWWDTVMVTCLG